MQEPEIIGRLKALELIAAQTLAIPLIGQSPEVRKITIDAATEAADAKFLELPEAARPFAKASADWILASAYNTAQQFQG
jgi:hypothetical protein